LGLRDELVGLTKFCEHPEGIKTEKQVVGGTKNIRIEAIDALKPDLIIANKEENARPVVEKLVKKYPVYVSDIQTIEGSISFAKDIGKLTDREKEAGELSQKLQMCMEKIRGKASTKKIRALYLIWKDPYMAAGTDSFISEMMKELGLQNVLAEWGDKGLRYPKITEEQFSELNPDVLLLSSEPYPFKESHCRDLEQKTGVKSILVNGEHFSWYGSRIVHICDELCAFAEKVQEGIG
jgi:ABC-type Fe3+-hydroxamate transport system substrate-binding protein